MCSFHAHACLYRNRTCFVLVFYFVFLTRLKTWNRHRYGRLALDKSEMDEYMFYVNGGSDFSSVMKGLGMANGGVQKNGVV